MSACQRIYSILYVLYNNVYVTCKDKLNHIYDGDGRAAGNFQNLCPLLLEFHTYCV